MIQKINFIFCEQGIIPSFFSSFDFEVMLLTGLTGFTQWTLFVVNGLLSQAKAGEKI